MVHSLPKGRDLRTTIAAVAMPIIDCSISNARHMEAYAKHGAFLLRGREPRTAIVAVAMPAISCRISNARYIEASAKMGRSLFGGREPHDNHCGSAICRLSVAEYAMPGISRHMRKWCTQYPGVTNPGQPPAAVAMPATSCRMSRLSVAMPAPMATYVSMLWHGA